MALIPVQVVQNDSDWFIIPTELYPKFLELSNKIEKCENHSDEWYNTIDEFEEQFAEYATGGDINIVNLYADI